MNYKWFLFSFEGRINRAKYWLAALIILCWMIFVLMVLAAVARIFGIGGPLVVNVIGISASIQLSGDPASKASLFPQIVTIPMTFVFGWAYAAASIKRLHDRNKSGWWIVPFIVATGLYGQFGDRLGGSYAAVVIGAYRVHRFLVGNCRDVLPERDARAQPVWARPAGPSRYGAALGPAERAGI